MVLTKRKFCYWKEQLPLKQMASTKRNCFRKKGMAFHGGNASTEKSDSHRKETIPLKWMALTKNHGFH